MMGKRRVDDTSGYYVQIFGIHRTMQRHRSKIYSFEDQIRLGERAALLTPGCREGRVKRKIDQLDTIIHINEWLRTPSAQSL